MKMWRFRLLEASNPFTLKTAVEVVWGRHDGFLARR